MEARVSLPIAKTPSIAQSLVMTKPSKGESEPKSLTHSPQHFDEQLPHGCVQLQQKHFMQVLEVMEGYHVNSRKIPPQSLKLNRKG